jgi:signal transduction histidine kinase
VNLSEFIERNVDAIVGEWAQFAQQNLPPARDLSPDELCDHAKQLLMDIADDMDTFQSPEDQHLKSRGARPGNAPDVTRTARADAEQRFRQGFSLSDVVAEYRALRASVVRRWTERLATPSQDLLAELTRFNEAVDQATGEAIAWYVDQVEQSRSLLLGMLGHDLRNPLGAASLAADYLLLSAGLTETQAKAVTRIRSSNERMRRMVDDLLDFTRTRLGGRLPIRAGPADLAQVCRQTVDELTALHPDCTVQLDCSGELSGQWDVPRIGQLLSNLVANAIQHGPHGTPVTVRVEGEADSAAVTVHNHGPALSPQKSRQLFDPLMRPVLQEGEQHAGSSGLGLGLYIVREIAIAHGGEVRVDASQDEGTAIEVRLPRVPPAPDEATHE